MKKLVFGVNVHRGIDCGYCSRDEYETFELELEDEVASTLEAALEGRHSLPQEEIESLCPEAAEKIDAMAYSTLIDICVVNAWEEVGTDACSKELSELFEADLESGVFSFTPEDADDMDEDELYDERCYAWEEAEEAKLDSMSLHEKSQYLQNRYGLECDASDTGYDYELLNR